MAAAKPVMRGLLHKQIRMHLTVAIELTIGTGMATRFILGNPRKETYKEYYKNYDIDKEFNKIRQTGVFQTVPAD